MNWTTNNEAQGWPQQVCGPWTIVPYLVGPDMQFRYQLRKSEGCIVGYVIVGDYPTAKEAKKVAKETA